MAVNNDTIFSDPKYKDFLTADPISISSMLVKKANITIDVKIFLSIVCSSGVRANEARFYKTCKQNGDILPIKVKLSKKRNKKEYRMLSIKPKEWGLTIEDYIEWQGKMRSYDTYLRNTKSVFNFQIKAFREIWAVFTYIHFGKLTSRNFLRHSSFSTTERYIKNQCQIDNLDLVQKKKEIEKQKTNNRINRSNRLYGCVCKCGHQEIYEFPVRIQSPIKGWCPECEEAIELSKLDIQI